MTIKDARKEVDRAWSTSYSPERNAEVLETIKQSPFQFRVTHLVARLFFRGIYFPQVGKLAWMKLIAQNRRPIFRLVKEGFAAYRASGRKQPEIMSEGAHASATE